MVNLKVIWGLEITGKVTDVGLAKRTKITVFGSSEGKIHCLDKIGKTLWVSQIDGEVLGVVPSKDGRFIFASSSSKIQCLDKSGDSLWEFETGASCIDYSDETGKVIAGSYDGTLYRLNKDGKTLWLTPLGNEIEKTAICGKKDISLAATRDNTVFCLDFEGKVLWKTEFNDKIRDLAISSDGEIISIGCNDFKIRTFDSEGNSLWEEETSGRVTALDICEDTKDIVAATDDNLLLCLTEQGEILWKQEMDDTVLSLALTKEGKGYVLGLNPGKIRFLENLEDNMDVFYEILCRGDSKCGTFVSAVYISKCPRCGSDKNVVRIIKESL